MHFVFKLNTTSLELLSEAISSPGFWSSQSFWLLQAVPGQITMCSYSWYSIPQLSQTSTCTCPEHRADERAKENRSARQNILHFSRQINSRALEEAAENKSKFSRSTKIPLLLQQERD